MPHDLRVRQAVNLLAAVVLFVLAVGNVQGFALTLGLTTIIDVVVVLLFTHPMLQLLARTPVLRRGPPADRTRPRGARRGLPRSRRSSGLRRSAVGAGKAARSSREAARARRSPSARRQSSPAPRRPRIVRPRGRTPDGQRLAKFGNDLYTGARSFDFVGRRKIWYSIAAVMIVLSILVPVVKGGFNFGIEFSGGSQFPISDVSSTDTDQGAATPSPASCPTPSRT